jgi:hypothetical protein
MRKVLAMAFQSSNQGSRFNSLVLTIGGWGFDLPTQPGNRLRFVHVCMCTLKHLLYCVNESIRLGLSCFASRGRCGRGQCGPWPWARPWVRPWARLWAWPWVWTRPQVWPWDPPTSLLQGIIDTRCLPLSIIASGKIGLPGLRGLPGPPGGCLIHMIQASDLTSKVPPRGSRKARGPQNPATWKH